MLEDEEKLEPLQSFWKPVWQFLEKVEGAPSPAQKFHT
jgi:hypothetical protein